MKNQSGIAKIRLCMLASGSGTNVQNFIEYFREHPRIEIALVAVNNPQAGVIERARHAGIPCVVIPRRHWQDGQKPLEVFGEHRIDFLILAGFLQLISPDILAAFPDRAINIHPALLPRFGGKGMYGMHVHRAVLESGTTQSGISIHLVNERYDEGRIIYQAPVPVEPKDTPESLAQKIHTLEYKHYPRVVEAYVGQLGIKK